MCAVLAACGGSGSDGPSGSTGDEDFGPVQKPASLVGEVGEDDAYAISLSDPDGNPIKNLAAGEYELEVEDYSDIHNFHLTGGDVNESTTVGEKTTKTFTVTFAPGDYTFVCDPHASQMSGSFHVT
jgi:hypothetical protein